MNSHQRAEFVYKLAEAQGLDAPTESMIAAAIADAVSQREMEIQYDLERSKFADAVKWLENLNELKSLEGMEQ